MTGRVALLGWCCLAVGCARNGILEVTLPFDDTARGLTAEVRVVSPEGRPGTAGPPRLVDASTAEHAYSVEVTGEPSSFTLEVCLCEASQCFLADGTCAGLGAARGGLYTFAHERTAFVGLRTRWTASTCPRTGGTCALGDPLGSAQDVEVDRCSVAGCCPLCMPDRFCSDPIEEIHRCE